MALRVSAVYFHPLIRRIYFLLKENVKLAFTYSLATVGGLINDTAIVSASMAKTKYNVKHRTISFQLLRAVFNSAADVLCQGLYLIRNCSLV